MQSICPVSITMTKLDLMLAFDGSGQNKCPHESRRAEILAKHIEEITIAQWTRIKQSTRGCRKLEFFHGSVGDHNAEAIELGGSGAPRQSQRPIVLGSKMTHPKQTTVCKYLGVNYSMLIKR